MSPAAHQPCAAVIRLCTPASGPPAYPNTAVPATKTRAPASYAARIVCSAMPPSTSISFYLAVRIAGVQYLPHLPNFPRRVADEFLPAESGIDRHHQHQVEFFDHFVQHVHRRGGADCHAGFLAQMLDVLD